MASYRERNRGSKEFQEKVQAKLRNGVDVNSLSIIERISLGIYTINLGAAGRARDAAEKMKAEKKMEAAKKMEAEKMMEAAKKMEAAKMVEPERDGYEIPTERPKPSIKAAPTEDKTSASSENGFQAASYKRNRNEKSVQEKLRNVTDVNSLPLIEHISLGIYTCALGGAARREKLEATTMVETEIHGCEEKIPTEGPKPSVEAAPTQRNGEEWNHQRRETTLTNNMETLSIYDRVQLGIYTWRLGQGIYNP
ncbi:uncharacterized protein LOC142100077 [Mixophyes fleayi]|uniref:uncharacterized protein LOC142100077 n=1 Tax=Mixophyes fleayi TaxID=3061075 RepID=UPI003F4DD93A